jgi:molybdopterin synthase sulfur carrier subunit
MIVNFFATLRLIVGAKSIEIALDRDETVEQVLNAIVHRFPELGKELFDEDGRLYRHVHVFVNGRDAAFLENGLCHILSDQDIVSLFPAIGGG